MAVPRGACDCHTHVFGDPARYPFAAGRAYTPGTATVEELLQLQEALGFERVVIVQPSPYGTDNSCTVDALRVLGNRARGVAVIDSVTPEKDLWRMHDAGVRGVRLNLQTQGQNDAVQAGRLLDEAAARVAPLGWHVQLYTTLSVLAALETQIGAAPVPIVIDHFGRAARVDEPGFKALARLVASGKCYVKLSAPHRLAAAPDCSDMAPVARALIAANPERMLWGTDWPHPATRRQPDASGIEPFDAIDDPAALARFAGWVGDPALLKTILVENPERLYDF